MVSGVRYNHVQHLGYEKISVPLVAPYLHQSPGTRSVPSLTRSPRSAYRPLVLGRLATNRFPRSLCCQHLPRCLAPCGFSCRHLWPVHRGNFGAFDWAAWGRSFGLLEPFETLLNSFRERGNMNVNLCSSRVEWVRNPELMESSDDASSSPLAGGACFPRGIITTLGSHNSI